MRTRQTGRCLKKQCELLAKRRRDHIGESGSCAESIRPQRKDREGIEMEKEKTRHKLTLSGDHTRIFLDDLELKHVIGYEISKSTDLSKNTAELTLHLVVEY